MAQGMGHIGVTISFGWIWISIVLSTYSEEIICCFRIPSHCPFAPLAALRFAAWRAGCRVGWRSRGMEILTTDFHGRRSLTFAQIQKCASAARPCWPVVYQSVSSERGSRRNALSPMKVIPFLSIHGLSYGSPVITILRKESRTWRRE